MAALVTLDFVMHNQLQDHQVWSQHAVNCSSHICGHKCFDVMSSHLLDLSCMSLSLQRDSKAQSCCG